MLTTTPTHELLARDGTELGVSDLRVGEQLRMRVALDKVDPIQGGAALSFTLTFERAAGGKPVCVANAIDRVYE